MDEQLTAQLEELHRYGVSHDADKPDRLDRLRNLEPDTAAVLAVLARAICAQRVLENGTSNGYSTLWLADAIRVQDAADALKESASEWDLIFLDAERPGIGSSDGGHSGSLPVITELAGPEISTGPARGRYLQRASTLRTWAGLSSGA